MKTKLFILFSFTILFSCNPKKTNMVVITGEISNLKGVVYLKVLKTNLMGLLQTTGHLKLSLKSPNQIILSLKLTKAKSYYFFSQEIT